MSDVIRTMRVKIQLRNDTASNFTTVNPILLRGEFGFEVDTNRFKIGDGATPWVDLPYASNQTIEMSTSPTAADWNYLVGTMCIVNRQRVYVLVSTAVNAGVWKEVVTADQIESLGIGDMLKSQFATNANAAEGYVDKAITSTQLSTNRQFSITGDVVSANVQFNGTANVTLDAALAEIMELAGGGTFIKVQVDSKGRVVGYEALLASDIPDLTLSKITDAGTAAGKNSGTAVGQVVIVGEGGYIDPSVMPSLSITDVFVVTSEAAMLALDATQGDVAVNTEDMVTYILASDDPTNKDNWIRIKTPESGVQTVNGKAGPFVTLNTDDVDEGNDNLYFTEERVIDVMETQASTILTDGATIVHETDILILNGGNALGHTP